MTTEAHPMSLQVPIEYIRTTRWISRESRGSYTERQRHYTAVLAQAATVRVPPSAANTNTEVSDILTCSAQGEPRYALTPPRDEAMLS